MDPDHQPDDQWKRLVDAAKKASPSGESEEFSLPPRGFTARVGNLRKTVQTLVVTLTWRRWSLIAAILAGLAYLVLYFILRRPAYTPPPPQPTDQQHLQSKP